MRYFFSKATRINSNKQNNLEINFSRIKIILLYGTFIYRNDDALVGHQIKNLSRQSAEVQSHRKFLQT